MSLEKTRGIVLHHIKYGDSSVIVTVYTEGFGRKAFMVNGVRSKKSRMRLSLFQPLSLLDMEVYIKGNRDIQRIKEVKNIIPFTSIPQNMTKTSVNIFIAELLYRTLYEEEKNISLFNFLFKSIELLESSDAGISNFHLFFLVKYSRFLGILPESKILFDNVYFDLRDGIFVSSPPFHENYLDKDKSQILEYILTSGFDDIDSLEISNELRQQLLDSLIYFYHLHLDKMPEIKSLQILREVFH